MEAGTEEQQQQDEQKQDQEEQPENGGDKTIVGRVEEVQGVVLEVAFADDLPEINNALEVFIDDPSQDVEGTEAQPESEGDGDGDGNKRRLICEVQQHLGD